MSGSFGFAPISPFPSANALLDIERLNQSQSPQAQQNRLLDLQEKQQRVGTNQIEYVSRAASVIDGVPEAEQPALYQQLGQQLVDAGVIPKLPPYPGPARIKQLAGMGVSAEKQLQQRSNIAVGRALLGEEETPPPTPGAAPSVPAVSTTGAVATPGSVATPGAVATPGVLPPTPQLAPVIAPGGAKFSVAAPHAPRFQALVDDLEASGYKIIPDQSGGYNRRYIAGTNTPSNHAHGSAIDINWTANARGGAGDIPPELARRLAAKHGLVWGGDWTGATRDPMHFEVAPQQPAAAPGGGRVQVASATPTVATDGTVAPPGATPVAAPAPAPALAAAPAAGQLNQGQRRQLRALVEAGRPTSEIITLQNQFRDENAAAANTAYQRQQNAEAAARDAKRLELDVNRAKREGLPTGYKLDDSGKAVRIDGLPPDPAVQEAQDKIAARKVAEGKQQFDQANVLRDEVNKLTETFRPLQESYERLGEAAALKNAQGDLGLIYTYTRMLDPATVHEEEVKRGMNAGGFFTYIKGMIARVESGELLTPELRAQFLDAGRKFYDVRKKGYDKELDVYRGLAKRFNLDPDTVVVSLAREQPDVPKPVVPPPLESREVGKVYPTPKGPMRWTSDGWKSEGQN